MIHIKRILAFFWGTTLVLLALSSTDTFAQTAVRDTALVGFTRTELTPLYYGLGTDRLGGARMETLDSSVVLNLTGIDSSGDFGECDWPLPFRPTYLLSRFGSIH